MSQRDPEDEVGQRFDSLASELRAEIDSLRTDMAKNRVESSDMDEKIVSKMRTMSNLVSELSKGLLQTIDLVGRLSEKVDHPMMTIEPSTFDTPEKPKRQPNPPIPGHALLNEGRSEYSGAWGYQGGCECGSKPPDWPNVGVNAMKKWHRLHKAGIRAATP